MLWYLVNSLPTEVSVQKEVAADKLCDKFFACTRRGFVGMLAPGIALQKSRRCTIEHFLSVSAGALLSELRERIETKRIKL